MQREKEANKATFNKTKTMKQINEMGSTKSIEDGIEDIMVDNEATLDGLLEDTKVPAFHKT